MFTRKVSVTNQPCGAGESGSQCNAYQAANPILNIGTKSERAVFTMNRSGIQFNSGGRSRCQFVFCS